MKSLIQFGKANSIRRILQSRSYTSTKGEKVPCCQAADALNREMLSMGQATYWSHPHLFDAPQSNAEQVLPGFSKPEFEARREQYVKFLTNYQAFLFKNNQYDLKSDSQSIHSSSTNFIAVIPSCTQAFMAPDVPYTFKQNSDFLYLTGFKEPDSLLVLSRTSVDEKANFKTVLFVRDKDPKKEVWEGACTGPKMVNKLCGIEAALPMTELDAYLGSLLKENSTTKSALWMYPTAEVVKESGPNCYNEFAEETLSRFYNQNDSKLVLMNDLGDDTLLNSSRTFAQLARVRKSAAEIAVMRRSCEIASDAFKETIRASHAHVNEHLLYAKFDYEARIRGAEHLSYIPVVGGGPRATVLHYIRNDQIVNNDRMVLMDAGCQYREYSSDITRTWPVNGRFRGAQKELYDACLNVQMHCLENCRKETTITALYGVMMKKMGQELVQLGILKESDISGASGDNITFEARQKIAKYCPHDVGHYLGLDVHDCPQVSKSWPLEPGAIITIEPGIYIKPDDDSVPARFRGIGIRIEDDVLITDSGHDVLSKKCPKTIDEIESTMRVEKASNKISNFD